MKNMMKRLAVWVLAAWLLLLSGVVYPQLAAHAEQHAHHSAATHANALCSWLCAAGQTAEGLASPALALVESVSPAVQQEYAALDLHPVSSNASRGPPSLIVSR